MRRVFLIGGGDMRGRDLDPIVRMTAEGTAPRTILIIPFATPQEKWDRWLQAIRQAYAPYGCDVKLFEESGMADAGMLFLTGGRPEMLFEKLAPFKDALQSFHGTIVGISAGALVLGPQYLATKDEDYPETILLPGLGIVPAIPSVHYSNADDPEILPFSQEHEILAIPDNAALEIRDTAMTPHGEVTVFSRDGKRRFEKAHKKSP